MHSASKYFMISYVNCFACMKLHSLEEAKAEMKKRIGETEYYFAIVLKYTGKVIGEIDAYPKPTDPDNPHTQKSGRDFSFPLFACAIIFFLLIVFCRQRTIYGMALFFLYPFGL